MKDAFREEASMQNGLSCELLEMLLNVTLSCWFHECSEIVQPSPVPLPLCSKSLTFFNMDQEMIFSVMGIFLVCL